jgi:hypothetical protein
MLKVYNIVGPILILAEYCYTLQHGDCRGKDIASLTGKTLDECKYDCTKTYLQCKSFKMSGDRCWFKNHACTKSELRGFGDKSKYYYTSK